MTRTLPLLATVLDGKFRIERALASGAAGDVYEATHLTLESRVAVKVLRDDDAAHATNGDARRRRFMNEARFAAGIQSEHVVRVFDFAAHEGGLTYLVMELLEGETLAQRARRGGPIPIATAVDYVIHAATALALLHEGGVVHRDVKPSNLFLARDSEGKERVKLLDFGVAEFRRSVSESSFAGRRAMIGTPRYMAPEQVRATEQVDARADVWALGVTLYELLAGRPPFDAESVLSVLKQIERKTPVPLRQRRPAVPARLAAVVQGCLEKDRAKRPASARALLDVLVPMRESLEGLEVPEASGDVLDLSWNDPDVEELRPVRRATRRRAVVTAALLCAGILAAVALRARSGSRIDSAHPAMATLSVDGRGASPLGSPALVAAATEPLESSSVATMAAAAPIAIAAATHSTGPVATRASVQAAARALPAAGSRAPAPGKLVPSRSAPPKSAALGRATPGDDNVPLE